MADPISFSPQSTFQVPGSTNPYAVDILHYSSVQAPLTLSGGIYTGSVVVRFPQYNNQYANLDVDAWWRYRVTAGSVVNYIKLPAASYNSAGNLVLGGTITIAQPAITGVYQIVFGVITTLSFDSSLIYYKIRTDKIALAGLDFISAL